MATKVMIDGVSHKLDRRELEFSAATIDGDMESVAAMMNNCGELWAKAEEMAALMEIDYRAWRAKESVKCLDKDPRLAEWKVKNIIEAMDQFALYKAAMARADQAALTMKNRFQAFEKKASAIQSRGAMLRSEFGATGMTTKESPPASFAEKKKSAKKKMKA